MSKQHRIVCAAIKLSDGYLVLGVRHGDILMVDNYRKINFKGVVQPDQQGFIDNKGNYLSRKEALVVAENANQIIKKHNPKNILMSEDMY